MNCTVIVVVLVLVVVMSRLYDTPPLFVVIIFSCVSVSVTAPLMVIYGIAMFLVVALGVNVHVSTRIACVGVVASTVYVFVSLKTGTGMFVLSLSAVTA